ncbi:hypothetical protein E2I00_001088 [Balaenoptera physalus]|uniref:Uncharacterized protein n=1 Tax=Balaenoptera physalus TaxID=9770 RepID=A0A643BSW9_BALPH|nr:hypothetical protein E2I00_001088 [Balaenoptera physalus]
MRGILFRDPYFPAGPDALGYDQLGPDSEKAKGVEWKRPRVMCGWGPGLLGLRKEVSLWDQLRAASAEFCAEPRFICEDMSRTDMCQGSNCWFLAAAASITLYPRLLSQVVPPGQSFQDGYAGVFHFQLWQFGCWVDVMVDDRLPVREGKLMSVRSDQRNEFWVPLLEKAYAKLHGSYEVMRGGHMNEAFVDFTGGVGEVLYLKQDTLGLFSTLCHALAKESLVGATALSDRGKYRTEDGLVKGHAYSVTDTHKDFLCHFATVQVCSLSPEVLVPSLAGGGRHIHTFQGRWVRGFNSGGGQPGAARAHARTPREIGLRTCEQLLQRFGEYDGSIAWMPHPQYGRSLDLYHFQQLWGHLLEWQGPGCRTDQYLPAQATFDKFDEDASGTMNSYELRLALNAAGFHLNNQLTQALTSRYRDSRLRVDFGHFASCMAQLISIFRHCSQHLDGGEGVVCLTHRQVSLGCREGWHGSVRSPRPHACCFLSPTGWRWPPPRTSAWEPCLSLLPAGTRVSSTGRGLMP